MEVERVYLGELKIETTLKEIIQNQIDHILKSVDTKVNTTTSHETSNGSAVS